MDVIETIRYLNSKDGPHMSLRAIAPYCGLEISQLSMYMTGKMEPREETRKRMEQGIKDLVNEIQEETAWLL